MDTIGKTRETTLRFNADVKEFKAAIKDARQAISLANAEFKVATAGASNWGNSVTGLESKLAQLNTVSKNQRTVLDNLNKELEAARRIYGEDSEAARGLAIEVAEQQAKVAKCDAAISRYTDQLEKAKKKAQQEESALGKLNSRIDGNEKNIQDLVQEYKNAVLQYGKNSSEAKALARQIKDLSGAVKDDKKEMEKADKAAADLTRGLDGVDGEARTAAEGFTVMKGAIANLVADGVRKLISGMKEVAKQTFTAGSNLESELAKVEAISGASVSDMEALKKKAMEMGASTKFTATEAAQGFEYMAMAGWKTEDMIAGLDGIMNLAAASGTDLATTSDIITDALTAFGAEAEDSARLADIIAAASSNANTNVEMMGETFKYAAPVAGALGYSMEDTALAIGLMANAGIKSSQAGTSLRAIMTNLASPTKSAAKWIEKLGISLTEADGTMKPLKKVIGDLKTAFSGLSESEQAAAAKAIAGKNGMSGLLGMINGADEDFNKLAGAISTCTGTAQDMADTMNNTVDGQITLLKSKVEGIMVGIYDRMAKSMRKSIDTASKALDKINWDKVAEGAGKVVEGIAKGFDWVVDHSDEVLAVLKAISVAFVTYKAVKIIGDVIGAFEGMKKAIQVTDGVMNALNGTFGLSPIALIAAGLGTIISLVVSYNKKQAEALEDLTLLSEEQQKFNEKAGDLAQAYEDQEEARKENNRAIAEEYGNYQDLWDELQDYLYSNGKVKEGYEERAHAITDILGPALDKEFEWQGDQILGYQTLRGEIDKVIEAQKTEALISANKSAYDTAIAGRGQAELDYLAAITNKNNTQADFDKVTKQIEDFEKAHKGEFFTFDKEYEAMKKQQAALSNDLEAQKQAITDTETVYHGYMSTIENYEGLLGAVAMGDAEQVNLAQLKMQYGFKETTTASKEELEQQAKYFDDLYQAALEASQEEGTTITQETVDSLKTMSQMAHDELNAANGLYAAAANENKKAYQQQWEPAIEEQMAIAQAVNKSGAEAFASTDYKTVAGAQVDDYMSSWEDPAQERMRNNVMAMTNDGVDAVKSANWYKPGQEEMDEFASGIESGKKPVKKAVGSVAAIAEQEMAEHDDDGRTHGENWGQGFANGIGSKVLAVAEKVRALTKTVKDTTAAELDEHSPSRIARQQGRYYGEGLGIGIIESLKGVRSSVKGEIGSLLTDTNRQLKAETPRLMEAVNAVRSGVTGISVTPGAAAQQQPANITFVQNNNSPKALDRLSIYRDTNSLLFGAKYAIGG